MNLIEKKVYSVGTLAYIDCFSGLVKCRVTKIIPREGRTTEVEAVIVEDKKAYKKGETVSMLAHWIVPCNHIKSDNGILKVLTNYRWE